MQPRTPIYPKIIGMTLRTTKSYLYTLPKRKISPETAWFKDHFPMIGKASFQRRAVSCIEGIWLMLNELGPHVFTPKADLYLNLCYPIYHQDQISNEPELPPKKTHLYPSWWLMTHPREKKNIP